MNTTKFFKKLTAAEVGNKGTHEVYIRMPNDFDYESFFENTHIVNGSVIEVNFEVTVESYIDKTLPAKITKLRFVYFANSNKEKRIPSLGPLFKEYNVQEGDVISLDKIEEGGSFKYYLRFLPQENVQIYNGGILLRNDNNIPVEFPKNISNEQKEPLQIIYYGAPGTGKSYTIDSMTTEENSVRTTFHPDSDYASFVGAYKPTMEETPLTAFVGTDAHFAVPKNGHPGTEKKIVYKYVPQAFLKAYVEAWKRYVGDGVEKETFDLPLYQNNNSAKDNEENKSNGISSYYLIIEEINRGNCAQIFGDLFQLLDRNNMGSSSYPIHADDDIARFLKEDEKGFAGLTESQRKAISDFILVKDSQEERKIGEDILNGKLLLLPPNLHVWATMNTSDQSLFPIDSAFKRRWDWEYTPISYNPKDKKTGEEINWTFEAGGNLYSWGEFLSKINPEIESLTESADKQMGYFFAKANPATNVISEKVFINKVLFYLWTEVLKDFDMGNGIFKNPETNKSFKFTDFFDENQNAVFNFLQNLKLTPLNPQNGNSSEDFEQLEDESRIEEIFEETSIENPSALQYSINDSEPFQKTYLAAEVFKKFISLNPLMTPNEVLNSWREKQKEWKAQKIYVPAHLIEDEKSYRDYIENSRGDKKKNEARFERVLFKDKYFYLWKGWGDGKNDNITPFLTAINSSGWDINIKRVNETSH